MGTSGDDGLRERCEPPPQRPGGKRHLRQRNMEGPSGQAETTQRHATPHAETSIEKRTLPTPWDESRNGGPTDSGRVYRIEVLKEGNE